jgi:glycosyltransferase involved in cell wall biosynthesis
LRSDFAFLGIGFFKGGEHIFEECERLTANFDNLMPVPGRSHIESLVNACDIGVLFSNKAVHGEGISNSLIEYMALGKPVVANDAGGTREIVLHGENGYLLDQESDLEIAKMINSLLNDEVKLAEMGRKSKERIYKDFSLDRMGREFADVYSKTIASNKF